MAVTLTSFRAAFPEFEFAPDAVINVQLNAAEEMVSSSDIYGSSTRDLVVQLVIADALARMPYARDLQLVNEDDSTTYEKQLERIRRRYGSAFRTVWETV